LARQPENALDQALAKCHVEAVHADAELVTGRIEYAAKADQIEICQFCPVGTDVHNAVPFIRPRNGPPTGDYNLARAAEFPPGAEATSHAGLKIRNSGKAPLKTLNVYVPPAYDSEGDEL
jgi:hypothetical protein